MYFLTLIPTSKRILFSACTLVAWAVGCYNLAQAQITTTQTFNYTGAVQTFVVPAGVFEVEIDARGAQGGNGGPLTIGVGGLGGRVTSTLSVTPGETLHIYVGGQGQSQILNTPTGGYNGGGGTNATSDDSRRPGAGGGATDIRAGGTALTDRIIVAGGGGGASGWTDANGGAGGGLTGQDGQPPYWSVDFNGKGGTQVAGGAGGSIAPPGALGLGGQGQGHSHGGGGGGGGYYGGGGGRVDAGGGGSSYTDPVAASNVIHTQGFQSGNGLLTITYPQCVLPSLPTTFVISQLDRTFTLTNVNIAGTGDNVSYVEPGQNVTLSFNYTIGPNTGTGCPGCVTQGYFGIHGLWSECYQNFGGYCNCSGTYTTSFTAPSTPGIYYITHGASWQFNCDPTPARPQNNTNGLAAIIVREEFTISSTDESCVGDANGSITSTPVFGTAGTSYLWSTSESTPTISGLSPGTYTVTSSDSYGCGQVDTIEIHTDTTPPLAASQKHHNRFLNAAGNASVTVAAIDSASSDACLTDLEIASSVLTGNEIDYEWLGNHNGHSYFLSKTATSWTAALTTAQAVGGDLVAINDLAENTFIASTLDAPAWIGLNDLTTEGTFVWSNSDPLTYTNWSPGEPNNLGDEDCAHYNVTPVHSWNDAPCGSSYRYIVEIQEELVFGASVGYNCSDTGQNTVILRATDQGGLVSFDTAFVQVADAISPNISVQNITIYLDSTGQANIAADTVNVSTADNCQLDSILLSQTTFDCSHVGPNNLTFSAIDGSGNVSTSIVTVTVADTLAPIIATQNITVYLDSSGADTITPAMVDIGTWDSCGIDSLYLGVYNFSCADTGLNTVTFFAEDVNGNTSSQTFNVTVLDTIHPVVVAQNDTVYLDINGQFTITTANVDNGSWDGCGITLSIDTANFDCANVGSPVAVTLTGVDPSGNTASDMAMVTVIDTIPPSILTQNLTLFLDSSGADTITAAMVDIGTWDSCGVDSIYLSQYHFNCAHVGINNIWFYALDVNGNLDSVNVTIDVFDNIAPHIAVQNITIQLDSFGLATITPAVVDIGTWDSCGIDSLYLDVYNFTCADTGLNTLTFFADDVNGNTSSQTFNVTVLDTIHPVVVAQNDTVYLDINGQFTITTANVDNGSWDGCGITLSIDTANFDCANVGSPVAVTLTGVDPSGNTTSDMAMVTVIDAIPPSILTQNLTLFLDSSGADTITAAMVDIGTWDSCGVDSIYLSQYHFNCAHVGINNIWFYALDVNGNLDSVNVTIDVFDNIAPHIAVQNITIQLDSFGLATITPAMVDTGTWDSCGIDSLYLDVYNFTCADTGLNTLTFFADDVNGNTSSQTFNVTVLDTIHPVVVAQNDTVYLDINGQFTITTANVDNGSWDGCGITLSIDTANFDCANVGSPVAVTLTGVDPSGNTTSDMAMVTVIDAIPPSILTQNLTLFLDSSGADTITAAMVDIGTWDSCGVDSIYLSQYHFNCAHVGINNIWFYALDVNGNLDSVNVTIDVFDNIAPHIAVQNITIQLDSAGTYTLQPAEIDNGTWDSCGIASYALDTFNFTCGDTGTIPVTMTVTDINGNVASATAFVTLEDTSSSAILTQNVTVYLDQNGDASITPAMIDSGSFDNCAIDTMWLSDYNFTCADTTSQTVTLSVRDQSGNVGTATAVVTILDTINPMVSAQNLVLYLNQDGESTIAVNDVDNGSFDNCAIDTMWLSDTLFECIDTALLHTITLYAKDVSGNMDSATATVQVFDTISPNVTAQNLTVYLDSFGAATIFPNQVDSNSLDNCGIDSSWISQNSFDCSHAGDSHTVFLFIKDVSGNVASDSALVFVYDTIAPEVLTQNVLIYLDSFGAASINTTMIDSGSWDACGIDTMWLSQYNYGCADVGVNSVNLFVQDVFGNLDSNTAAVTVVDTIAPKIITQNLFIYLDSFGVATIDADSINNGTWDSCGVSNIFIDSTNFSCASHGDTVTITFTAEDVNGNVSIDSAFVYVLDTLPPVVLALSDTIYLDTAGEFTIDFNTLNNGTYDNCSVGMMYLSDSTFNCANVDSTWQLFYIAEDVFGNADSTEISITVLDTINPSITCLDSIVVSNDPGQCGALVTFNWPSATDNCSIDTMIQIDSTGLDSGMVFPVGVTTLTYAVFDQSGNSDTCAFVIEVRDVEIPQLFCVPDTAICDTTFLFSLPQYTDNCSGFEVIQIAGIDSGAFYPVGITVNTFIVSDFYGNTDTCSFEVLRYDFPSAADAGADQELCAIQSATMAGNTPAVGFGVWAVVGNSATIVDSLDNATQVDDLTVGFTTLEWRVENGVCPIERDSMNITLYADPADANAGVDIVVCDTNAVALGAIADSIGFGTWLTPGSGLNYDDSSNANTVVNGLQLGDYTFTWQVENGVCPTTTDEVTVSVVPYPVVDAGEDFYIFHPSNPILSASSDLAVSYQWYPSYALQTDTGANVLTRPTETTTYIVEATTEFGCLARDTIVVGVNVGLELPTAFTPDGDLYNDVWNLKELESYPNCVVKIYNRWGNQIFESEGYVESWDGSYRGEPLPSGSYFFVIELGVPEVPPITGSVTIIK